MRTQVGRLPRGAAGRLRKVAPLPVFAGPAGLARLAVGAWLLAAVAGAGSLRGGEADEAERFLRVQRGLQQLGNSGIWLHEQERRLREDLGRLPRLLQMIDETAQELAVAVQLNQRAWSLRQAGQGTASALPATTGPGSGEGAAPAADPAPAAVLPPAQLGQRPDVRRRLIRLANLRNRLSMTLARVRETATKMVTQYEQLRGDARVQAALGQVGAGQRLGPARDYAAELAGLGPYYQRVNTAWVPAYWQGPHLRFSGILNEQIPTTFTWSADAPRAVVAASIVAAAGLELPPDVAAEQVTIAGRTLTVRPFRIPYLQFGSCLLRGVPAYALPPEGEDLGCRIGAAAFAGYQVAPQPQQLRVVMRQGD